MRSISASTCAISSSAFGESVKLVSAAPGASAPSVAITATGPSTTPVIKALIQRDLVIRTSIAPKRRRHGAQSTIQFRVAASFGPEIAAPRRHEAERQGDDHWTSAPKCWHRRCDPMPAAPNREWMTLGEVSRRTLIFDPIDPVDPACAAVAANARLPLCLLPTGSQRRRTDATSLLLARMRAMASAVGSIATI